ncbi:hypothetical protein EDB84DRAFT_1676236 [Lactarius hengduanensis]|nr:hypothetical protein EDB84DRAFT_1676236 [Lactarius hengduanensis]
MPGVAFVVGFTPWAFAFRLLRPWLRAPFNSPLLSTSGVTTMASGRPQGTVSEVGPHVCYTLPIIFGYHILPVRLLLYAAGSGCYRMPQSTNIDHLAVSEWRLVIICSAYNLRPLQPRSLGCQDLPSSISAHAMIFGVQYPARAALCATVTYVAAFSTPDISCRFLPHFWISESAAESSVWVFAMFHLGCGWLGILFKGNLIGPSPHLRRQVSRVASVLAHFSTARNSVMIPRAIYLVLFSTSLDMTFIVSTNVEVSEERWGGITGNLFLFSKQNRYSRKRILDTPSTIFEYVMSPYGISSKGMLGSMSPRVVIMDRMRRPHLVVCTLSGQVVTARRASISLECALLLSLVAAHASILGVSCPAHILCTYGTGGGIDPFLVDAYSASGKILSSASGSRKLAGSQDPMRWVVELYSTDILGAIHDAMRSSWCLVDECRSGVYSPANFLSNFFFPKLVLYINQPPSSSLRLHDIQVGFPDETPAIVDITTEELLPRVDPQPRHCPSTPCAPIATAVPCADASRNRRRQGNADVEAKAATSRRLRQRDINDDNDGATAAMTACSAAQRVERLRHWDNVATANDGRQGWRRQFCNCASSTGRCQYNPRVPVHGVAKSPVPATRTGFADPCTLLDLHARAGLCPLGHRAMTLCRGALGLSDPTWYIRLPPVSEDKGQYSMPRGGQSQAVSSGFEPAKVLVRGHRYPDRCAFRDHLGSLPVLRPTRGVGWHSTARRDPW